MAQKKTKSDFDEKSSHGLSKPTPQKLVIKQEVRINQNLHHNTLKWPKFSSQPVASGCGLGLKHLNEPQRGKTFNKLNSYFCDFSLL